ncbi:MULTISPECIES: hypothetical protein [Myxococcus]|uniref:hypothetical protein n=1 Tax=Myxococcus TaxID=32 RepID=UPI00112E16AF|nr:MULTISPECIES: hypothetical protein [Myxococcus]QDE81512.1 hypothetical protein BHS07_07975 [Myxococcus xanthus]WAM28081.1 hypothetical protein OZ403_08120 [Myxococcus sp. NMCA1]
MRRLAIIPLFALFGCGYVQLGIPGGAVDLGSPRNARVGVLIRQPANEPLEGEPEREDKAPDAPVPSSSGADTTPAP